MFFTIPILQMNKLRLRELVRHRITQLAGNLGPPCLISEPASLISMLHILRYAFRALSCPPAHLMNTCAFSKSKTRVPTQETLSLPPSFAYCHGASSASS